MEQKLKEELKQAQLSRDEIKVSTLRLLISEINNAKIAKGGDLSSEDLLAVVKREAKKRKESVEAFKNAGRVEAADKEAAELKILEAYLPAQLSTEELTKLVEDSINEVGATSVADMGKVIGLVMSKSGGAADGGSVSVLVKQKLING